MSKQDLSKVIGRALLDKTFAADLKKNPAAAAKSIGAKLSADEVQALSDLSASHIKAVSSLLRKKLDPVAWWDQQQQQQQARMD
jgi:hypothetical protein